jgi:predicted house-cleaning noncanonical NTP pyrophosphatase (MazG superfamily)
MLRIILVFLSLSALLFASPSPDRNALIAKLQRDLDKAMSRGTPTDKEILELRKSRQDLTSTDKEELSNAIETIDRIAHTQSFKSQDASDIRKDIGNIRGHKSFLFLRLP